MTDRTVFVLTFVAALGCGVVGGVFFGFSAFVMRALARLAPPAGIAAMQSINVVVINRWFMSALFGTAAVCAVLAGWAVVNRGRAGAGYLLAGGLLYLVGTIGVTVAFHVPRNNALAVVDPASEAGAAMWARYVTSWTAGNHVRTAAAVAAAGVFVWALVKR
jgi:uncharacterized membrane protein